MPPADTLGKPVPLFSDPSHAAEYQLLELPKEVAALLEKAAEEGGSRKRKHPDSNDSDAEDGDSGAGGDGGGGELVLTINGRQQDEAVLCTRDASYTVRGVAVSNAMMLCDLGVHPSLRHATPRATDGSAAGNVRTRARENAEQCIGLSLRAALNTTLELQHTSPRLTRLRELLALSAYCGPRAEARRKALPGSDPATRLYTMHQVRSAVQASPRELAAGLDEARIAVVDGHARMVSDAYLADEVLRLLLAHVEMNAFPADGVPLALAEGALQEGGVPASIAHAVLTRWFARPAPRADANAAPGESVALDMPSVARALGQHTLRVMARAAPRIPLDQFVAAWQAALGANWTDEARIELLEGEHYLLPSPLLPDPAGAASRAGGTKIVRLAESDLSTQAPTRFSQLFAARAQWPKEELLPYVAPLAPDAHKRDALLLKFCRAHTIVVPPPGQGHGQRRGRPAAPGRKVVVYTPRLRAA